MPLAGATHPGFSFAVDYAERPLNRVTTAFRAFVAIPIIIVLGAVGGAAAGGLLFLGPLLMVVFRNKYPRWWFDWNLALWRFENRVSAYVLLMRDEYPATDEDQAVHLDADYPDVPTQLNRWMPLVKWFLAIPHYVVLAFLWIAAVVVTVIAWFAILFTGTYPRGMFDFVVGVLRWTNRVLAYAGLMLTDEYPPFRLSA